MVSVGYERWVRLLSASLHAWMPSECGILVYNEVTSRVTRIESAGKLLRVLSLLRKWLVSLMYDGSLVTKGLRLSLTNSEMRSVGCPLAEMIGLPGGGLCFLCIKNYINKYQHANSI